jgi:hypothetical protein
MQQGGQLQPSIKCQGQSGSHLQQEQRRTFEEYTALKARWSVSLRLLASVFCAPSTDVNKQQGIRLQHRHTATNAKVKVKVTVN